MSPENGSDAVQLTAEYRWVEGRKASESTAIERGKILLVVFTQGGASTTYALHRDGSGPNSSLAADTSMARPTPATFGWVINRHALSQRLKKVESATVGPGPRFQGRDTKRLTFWRVGRDEWSGEWTVDLVPSMGWLCVRAETKFASYSTHERHEWTTERVARVGRWWLADRATDHWEQRLGSKLIQSTTTRFEFSDLRLGEKEPVLPKVPAGEVLRKFDDRAIYVGDGKGGVRVSGYEPTDRPNPKTYGGWLVVLGFAGALYSAVTHRKLPWMRG